MTAASGEAPGGAEVDEAEAPVVEHHDVAGMGIGVEVAVDQHLLQAAPEELVAEGGPVEAEGRRCARSAAR